MVLIGFVLLINFQFGPFLGMTIMSTITLGDKIHKMFIRGILVMSIIMVTMGIPIILYSNLIISNIFSLILLCILMLFMGIAIAFVNIPIMTCFHRLVPDEYGGRFWGMYEVY